MLIKDEEKRLSFEEVLNRFYSSKTPYSKRKNRTEHDDYISYTSNSNILDSSEKKHMSEENNNQRFVNYYAT